MLIVGTIGFVLATLLVLIGTLMVVALLRVAIDSARHIRAMRYRLDETPPTPR